MFDGFIPGSRASLMLDVVVIGMFVILPILFWSIRQVRAHRNFALHKKVQLFLGFLLLFVVVLFEVDIRIYGWQHLAEASPHYNTILFPVLYVHLFFAITTTFLWIFTIVNAVRKFDSPPSPNPYSVKHKRLAWLSTIDMCCTTITGWTFYYLAFVAS